MNASSKNDTNAENGEPGVDQTPIALLETIRSHGRVWGDLAAQYGVTNPDPPWKVNLEATCDALSAEACALPLLERRSEEDVLSASLYSNVPFPERQLLALAHSMIKRGLVDEKELASRMKQVHDRLTSV
ncbi:MAG TPA: hypothetical protein VFU39_04710 [Sulfuricaulis sp.]|nr:hypothetical protein [Sulfuricaulis sp.]